MARKRSGKGQPVLFYNPDQIRIFSREGAKAQSRKNVMILHRRGTETTSFDPAQDARSKTSVHGELVEPCELRVSVVSIDLERA